MNSDGEFLYVNIFRHKHTRRTSPRRCSPHACARNTRRWHGNRTSKNAAVPDFQSRFAFWLRLFVNLIRRVAADRAAWRERAAGLDKNATAL